MNTKKWCWIATEVKGGWKLKLCIGNVYFKSQGHIIKSMKAVENFTNVVGNSDGKVVFIHLKNTKYPVK